MPHKHRRNKTGDKELFELPPESVAAPLPVTKPVKSASNTSSATKPAPDAIKKRNAKRKALHENDDDTPRAFARLMAWTQGTKPRSGLDDGTPKSKKRKRANDESTKVEKLTESSKITFPVMPKLMVGERMIDYSRRVDAALPIGGLVGRNKGKDPPGVKKQQTKTERKMQKMQKEWREVDARWKEKLKEAQEEAEEQEDPAAAFFAAAKSGKKSKKKKQGADSDDEDPWDAVAKARKKQTQPSAGLVGLHDVVLAPPQLKAPKEKFKMREGARVDVLDVPNAAGSLRRREELGETRRSIVEGYRHLMKKRRNPQDTT